METKGHHGSFLGFTYNGIHSSALGITHVSTSNRYTDAIIPVTKDTTASIQGIDGMVYWGTIYTKRTFTVSFAFDGVSEENLKKLRNFLDGKYIRDLIFDERPYKIYSAKITGTTLAKYIAFDDNGANIYKGEGSITFTCYFPYARSRYAWQEDYTIANIPEWSDNADTSLAQCGNIYYDFEVEQDAVGALSNLTTMGFEWVSPTSLIIDMTDTTAYGITMNGGIIPRDAEVGNTYVNYDDWIESSHIPSRADYGTYDDATQSITLFNAGDVAMPTQWRFRVSDTPQTITFICDGETKLVLSNVRQSHIVSPTGAGADAYIIIDMPRATIQGYDQYQRPTGRLYHEYITEGNFFGIPLGAHSIEVPKPLEIKFNYLYL